MTADFRATSAIANECQKLREPGTGRPAMLRPKREECPIDLHFVLVMAGLWDSIPESVQKTATQVAPSLVLKVDSQTGAVRSYLNIRFGLAKSR